MELFLIGWRKSCQIERRINLAIGQKVVHMEYFVTDWVYQTGLIYMFPSIVLSVTIMIRSIWPQKYTYHPEIILGFQIDLHTLSNRNQTLATRFWTHFKREKHTWVGQRWQVIRVKEKETWYSNMASFDTHNLFLTYESNINYSSQQYSNSISLIVHRSCCFKHLSKKVNPAKSELGGCRSNNMSHKKSLLDKD